MKNILVPTDLLDVALNAAEYAVNFANYVGAEKIILYNAYQAPIVTEPWVPAMQMLDFDNLKNISNTGLQQLKTKLSALPHTNIAIEIRSDFSLVSAGIEDVCNQLNIDLIILGITDGNILEEILIGSTATELAQHTSYPVLIVPPNAIFVPVKKVLFACDYEAVATTTPVADMKKVFGQTIASLNVLHVNEHEEGTYDYSNAMQFLAENFSEYEPNFYFVKHNDFVEGLQQFLQTHPSDLLVTIPKKHGLFERLFKRSRVKHLAFHTNVPLLCIHQPES